MVLILTQIGILYFKNLIFTQKFQMKYSIMNFIGK